MKPRQILLAYQLLLAASDSTTGALLLIAPALTLHLMRLQPASPATLPFLSYIGAFVLSTGLACLYGAWLTTRPTFTPKLEVVWLLTALTRGCVSLFVFTAVFSNKLENGWLTVALSDGLFAALQLIGLYRNWLPKIEAQ